MSSIFERLAAGPGALQQSDYDNWNQAVGSAPPDQFGRAAYNAMRQLDPQEYYNHTQPGVGGTDPFGALGGGQRTGLVQTLLSTLMGRGIGYVDAHLLASAALGGDTTLWTRDRRLAAVAEDLALSGGAGQ